MLVILAVGAYAAAAMLPAVRIHDSTPLMLGIESGKAVLYRVRDGKRIGSLVLRQDTPVSRSRDGRALLIGDVDPFLRVMADWRPMVMFSLNADLLVIRGIDDVDAAESMIRAAIATIK